MRELLNRKQNDDDGEFVDRKYAAKFLKLKEGTLCVWASNKRYSLPYYKIGGRAFYKKSDLIAWRESRRVGEPLAAAQGG